VGALPDGLLPLALTRDAGNPFSITFCHIIGTTVTGDLAAILTRVAVMVLRVVQ